MQIDLPFDVLPSQRPTRQRIPSRVKLRANIQGLPASQCDRLKIDGQTDKPVGSTFGTAMDDLLIDDVSFFVLGPFSEEAKAIVSGYLG